MQNVQTRSEVLAAVADAIRQLGITDVEILPLHDLHGDLGIDSTEMVELAAIVRGHLGLDRERLNLRTIATVADLVAQLESMLAPEAAS